MISMAGTESRFCAGDGATRNAERHDEEVPPWIDGMGCKMAELSLERMKM